MSAAGDRLQDTARRSALALADVSHGYPFTPGLDVYKVAGRVFLIVTDDPGEQIITVKCEPEHARAQQRFHASITPGRYLDKRHWISLGPGPGITEVIIPEVLDGDRVSLEGHDFELRGGHPDLVWRTEYLWQPEDRAVVGGVLLFADLHVWTADTPTPRERAAWAETLAEMERLAPRFVAAGHRSADSPTDASVIVHTRAYLAEFEKELAQSGNDSEALKAALLARHPDLGLLVALDLGTEVATGETSWG